MTRRITRRQALAIGTAGVAFGATTLVVMAVGAADAPQVQRMRVSQMGLARGNQFTVTVSITGDVRTATITYQTPRGGALTQTLRFTYGDNYEASFFISGSAPIGIYRVDSITARDANNRVALRLTAADDGFADLVRDASVTVTADGNPSGINPPPGDNGQSSLAPIATIAPAPTVVPAPTAPPDNRAGAVDALAFVSTSVSQNLLAFGNAFTVRAVLRGPVDTVRVTYAFPGGDTTHTLIFDYQSGNESHYESAFTVADGLPLGQYTISRLYAEGADGSTLDLAPPPDDPLVAGSIVTVTSDGNPVFADTSGGLPSVATAPPPPASPTVVPTATPRPTLAPATATATPAPPAPTASLSLLATSPIRFTAVSLSSHTVRPGSSFTVSVTIEDSDGLIVGQPVVNFSDGKRELFAFFDAMRTGMYRATVPVSQYYPEGTYALTRLYAYDDRGNTLELRPPDTTAFGADITVRR